MRPRYCDGKKSIKSFGVLRGSSLACLKGLKVIILQGTLKSQTLDKKLISHLLLTFTYLVTVSKTQELLVNQEIMEIVDKKVEYLIPGQFLRRVLLVEKKDGKNRPCLNKFKSPQ